MSSWNSTNKSWIRTIKRGANSAIFRCRAKWHIEGEKNSKYFFNLEKANYRRKTVHAVKTEAGLQVKEAEILQECHQYFSNAFKSKSSKQFALINTFGKTVSAENCEKLDQPLREEEFFKCLKLFKNEKAPGCDGLPAEFYKCFLVEATVSTVTVL